MCPSWYVTCSSTGHSALSRRSLILSAFAAAFCSGAALAETPYSVTVSAAGHGQPVRVIVTSRSLAGGKHSLSSCDDGTDVSILFDQMVESGQTFSFASPRECVCYQQGRGTFRRIELRRARDRCADSNRNIFVAINTSL